MARIRTIKPQHWDDRRLPEVSLQAHLLWIASWNFSDDKGIFEADPILIKSKAFPRRTDIRIEQVSQWLDQLVKARFIVPFNYNDESYYVSRTFETHQKIDKPQPSKIPSEIIRGIFDERSSNGSRSRVEYSNVNVGESNASPCQEESDNLTTKGPPPPLVAPPPSPYNGPPMEEVMRFFRGAGGSEDMANGFWNKWEAVEWIDNGSRIKNWTNKANNYIATWHRNEKQKQDGRKSNQQDQHPRGAVITGNKDYGKL